MLKFFHIWVAITALALGITLGAAGQARQQCQQESPYAHTPRG